MENSRTRVLHIFVSRCTGVVTRLSDHLGLRSSVFFSLLMVCGKFVLRVCALNLSDPREAPTKERPRSGSIPRLRDLPRKERTRTEDTVGRRFRGGFWILVSGRGREPCD